jgi:hypothetical protein
MRRRASCLAILAVLLTVVVIGGWLTYSHWRGRPVTMSEAEFEAYARQRFASEHPGEQPLDFAIGAAAERFSKAKAMGKFVLSLESGKWGNDCSDFVNCSIDEGLSLKARFKRGSDRHLVGESLTHFRYVPWDRRSPLRPGDVVSVAHSPWYRPYKGANWHVGLVGTDGLVYDYVKLKSWRGPRYGRHTPAWFIRHSPGKLSVVVTRLRTEYAYRLKAVEAGPGHY